MDPVLREAFDREWTAAEHARERKEFAQAFGHLERAHILGQKITRLHVKSHLGFLRLAWVSRDYRAVPGQLTRTIASLLVTWIWVPVGNTGGTNVSPFRPMPIPEDLQAILRRE